MFFPQAVAAGVGWRLLDLPIIPVAILLRIVTLLTYILVTWFAIRIIPKGKWALLAVALLPTSLYQAATVNGDSYTNAVSFLFMTRSRSPHDSCALATAGMPSTGRSPSR